MWDYDKIDNTYVLWKEYPVGHPENAFPVPMFRKVARFKVLRLKSKFFKPHTKRLEITYKGVTHTLEYETEKQYLNYIKKLKG